LPLGASQVLAVFLKLTVVLQLIVRVNEKLALSRVYIIKFLKSFPLKWLRQRPFKSTIVISDIRTNKGLMIMLVLIKPVIISLLMLPRLFRVIVMRMIVMQNMRMSKPLESKVVTKVAELVRKAGELLVVVATKEIKLLPLKLRNLGNCWKCKLPVKPGLLQLSLPVGLT